VLAVEISDEDYKLLQAYKKTLANKRQPPHKAEAPAQPPVSDADHKLLKAHKETLANKQLPPHKAEAPNHPSGSKAGSLSESATNPIANLIQAQVLNQFNWKNHNSDGYSNATIGQAVLPFKLPWESVPLLITRTTLPYVTTPDLGDPVGRKRGFGDSNILLLATPKLKTKGVQVGLGINSAIPTAGDNDFTGSGKWQIGPSGLYINMQTPKLQWGMFGYQLWDFASSSGNSDRPGVSKLSLQPILIKHFDGGWYIGTPDLPQTYDFNANKWTWNLGGQAGRVTKFGKQPVKLFGEVLYNPEDENGPTAEWTARIGLTFLFPK
jgi:hypothetical protein